MQCNAWAHVILFAELYSLTYHSICSELCMYTLVMEYLTLDHSHTVIDDC